MGARTIGKALVSIVSLKVIIIAVLIIITIIVLIGLISFIFLAPEMVRGKVVGFLDDIWIGFKGIFIGQAEAQVRDEDVNNIATYLENMGFKLKGYGFGEVTRDSNGKVTNVDSKYLRAYMAAENKTYMIANQNFNFRDFMNNLTSDKEGSWGSGMIVLNRSLWQNIAGPSVSIDRKNQTMDIHMKYKNSNEVTIYQYNLDGWMGRYGKPLEFLLTLHVGTMAPDFAYEVAVGDEFDTKVIVKFKKVGITTRMYYTKWGVTLPVISYEDPDTKQKIVGWDKYISEYTREVRAVLTNPIYQINPADIEKKTEEYVINAYGFCNKDVEQVRKEEIKRTKFIYKPYIRAVNNHWFRDLDFEDAYVLITKEAVTTGDYQTTNCTFSVQEERRGDIAQVREPKIVGKDASAQLKNTLIDSANNTQTTNTGTTNTGTTNTGTTNTGTTNTGTTNTGTTNTGTTNTGTTNIPSNGFINNGDNKKFDINDPTSWVLYAMQEDGIDTSSEANNEETALEKFDADSEDDIIGALYEAGILAGNTSSGNTTPTPTPNMPNPDLPSSSSTGSSSSSSANSVISSEYEGYRLDELFKKTYKIADGLNGVSDKEEKLEIKNTMKYAISMLENVHTQDAECILRDLKRYLTKRGFVFRDEYIITSPEDVEKKKKDESNYENVNQYDGKKYVPDQNNMKGPTSSQKGDKTAILGPIFKDGMKGAKSEGNDIVLYPESEKNTNGFKKGEDVISPGDGTVEQATSDSVMIKLSTKGVENFKILISGFNCTISRGLAVTKGVALGTASSGNITVQMWNAQGQKVNASNYFVITGPIDATNDDVEALAKCIAGEAGGSHEGMVAVAYVILHRVENKTLYEFKNLNTIYDVINAPGQFEGKNGPATAESRNVALNVLSGLEKDPLAGAFPNGAPSLFFLAWQGTGFSSYTREQLIAEGYAEIGGNVFSHDGHDMF